MVMVFFFEIRLPSDTTPPPDYEAVDEHTAPCQCVCTERGEAVVQPTCADVVDPFRPLTTLPPAIEGECPCKVAAHSGRCPSGYFFSRGYCYGMFCISFAEIPFSANMKMNFS